MKFNFFFISYSVIYAKYNYCYDVPKDMPTRYFDGKEWKIMKTRNSLRTKAPKHLNFISKEIDWNNVTEMKEIDLKDSRSDNSIYYTRTRSTNMFRTTSTPFEYIMNTKRPAPIREITIKQNPRFCKLRKITTTTLKPPEMKKIENKDWTFIRPTIKHPVITKDYVKTTKKGLSTRLIKELVTSRMSAQVSGAQGDSKNVSENWSNLMKEFLKFVGLKKCDPRPCIPKSATKGNLILPAGHRRTMMSQEDDLMNILIDGVQIDDGLNEDGGGNYQNTLVPSEEALDDQSQIFDFESDEGFIDDYVQDFSGDNDRSYSGNNDDVEVKSNLDTVKAAPKQQDETTLSRKNEAFLEESKPKGYKVPPIENSEEYINEFNQKNAPKSDEIVHDREIKSYLKALLSKHVTKENVPAEDRILKAKYENNARRRNEDKNIIKQTNEIDLYDKNYEDNLVDFSKSTLNSKESNEVSESNEIVKSKTNDGDVYQNSDITIDSDFLEDDNIEADR